MTGVPRFDPSQPFTVEALMPPMAALPPDPVPAIKPAPSSMPKFDPSQPYTVEGGGKSWAETGKEALSNLGPSAVEFGKAMVQPIIHPIDTAAALKDIGLGVLQKVRNLSPEGQRGSMPAFDESKADAVGKHFVDRYGSMEGIQKAIGEDPVGVAADLSMILTGGGSAAARLPGVAGRVGEVVAQTGRAVDPINAVTKPLAGVRAVAEPVAANVIGLTTGAGAAPLREAAGAGREGGARQAAFLNQMRGNAPIADIVDNARGAVEEMRRQRGDAYRAGMGGVTNDPAILDFAPVDRAINRVAEVGTYDGKIINRSAAPVWENIRAVVDDWRNADPTRNHTVEGFDALKKSIGDIRDSTQPNTPARRIADEVYQAVRGQIVQQAPAYGQVMQGYEHASEALRDLESTLSLGNRSSTDAAVRKLQSIMRNNANTNYGRRVEMGNALTAQGADDLFPQIAGQALSSATPRGLQGVGATLGSLGTAAINPMFLPGAVVASPRVMGEIAHFGGVAMRGRDAIARALRNVSPVDPYTARMLMLNAGRAGEE